MDYYLDIHLLPDPETLPAQLMNALFTKLHLLLVDLKSNDIGISFPEFKERKPSLGSCLRLHSTVERLQQVAEHPYLTGLRDYLQISQPASVPANARHRQVRRIQIQSNPERLLRRQMRRHGYQSLAEARQTAITAAIQRHGLNEMDAAQRIDSIKTLPLPFINLRSQSTGQPFRLFIQHGPLGDKPVAGRFNAY